ncbi:MAG: sel1 repeat family protein [Akkermansia sp.]|nr:sel1 repeat family protein [Akkermansia sp.]
MNETITSKPRTVRRAMQASLQVLILVLGVPLGILGGWYALAPSPARLAEQAAGGADSAALLELVQRAPHQQQAADVLHELLGQDSHALKALVGLASGHEAACLHLIYVARSQPAAFDKLSGVPMTYSLALALVRHMTPEGFSRLEQMAGTHADACFILGVACEKAYLGATPENGVYKIPDLERAAYWYDRARTMGSGMGTSHYGRLAYHFGLLCYAENAVDAVCWFREAAACNHAEAQCALGVCYASGEGVEKNLEKAVEWYCRSAEQGYVEAQYNLGLCYLHGEGVEADVAASAQWFRKAAEQEDAPAQYYLGYCFAEGKGVAQDWKNAASWFLQSASQNYTKAQLALAECYERGLGVAPDAATARYWRSRAAENSQITIPES